MKDPALVVLLMLAALAANAQDCSQFNATDTPYDSTISGYEGHTDGYHKFAYIMGGSCTYSGSTPGKACASTCTSTASAPAEWEVGHVTPVLYHHEIGEDAYIGIVQAPAGGTPIQCAVTVAGAVNSCLLSCAVSIGFSGSTGGIGISISFPAQAVFKKQASLTTSCPPKSLPACSGSGGPCCGGQSTVCVAGTWACSGGAHPA